VRNEELWKHIWQKHAHRDLEPRRDHRGDDRGPPGSVAPRFLELIEKYGFERVFRRRASTGSTTPSGRFRREDRQGRPNGVPPRRPTQWLDDDGEHIGVPLPVELAIEVRGGTASRST